MPSERIHRMQAERNERLARGLVLLSPQLMDWEVTFVENLIATELEAIRNYIAQIP